VVGGWNIGGWWLVVGGWWLVVGGFSILITKCISTDYGG